MDRLKGKTILIGRDAEQGRLAVAVLGNAKVETLGSVGSVPNSVSRCRPDGRTAHCKIDVDQSGTMTLTNLKPENFTYVGGLQVQSKKIDTTSAITLGRDKYPINLNMVLQTAIKLVGTPSSPLAPQPQTFSIKHLKKVWDEYEEAMEAIQRKQQERGRRRMLPIMIGTVSAVLAPIVGYFASTKSLWVTIPIAAISFIIYFRNYTEKDTSIEDRKNVANELYDNYVCPNPSCRHFMGNQPYKLVRQNKNCPYCRCNLTE